MGKVVKKIIACMMAAVIAFAVVPGNTVFAAISPLTSVHPKSATNVTSTEGLVVTTSNIGVAALNKATTVNSTTYTVSDKATVKNITYTVTKISANAFANVKGVKTINIPSSITKIAKKAFKGCSSLRKINLNTTKAVKFAKGAFSGLKTKKIKIVVSKSMSYTEFNKLKTNLKAIGFKGKVKKAV